MKYGSHISFSKSTKYLIGACEETLSNKANSMMIYLGGPQSSLRVGVENYLLDEYKEKFMNQIRPEDIIVHAPYIINPSSLSKSAFAIQFMKEELKRMNFIGSKYIVLHPGSATDGSIEECLEQLVKSIKEILSTTKEVVILLETMSGKGNELGINFEQLKYVIDNVSSERLGICLDTCHIWDAGYDLSNPQKIISELEENGLLHKIKVIHVNDSKNPLGAHKDRHENIGRGFIGLNTIKNFINLPYFDNVYKILETPFVDDKPIYNKEIEMLFNK